MGQRPEGFDRSPAASRGHFVYTTANARGDRIDPATITDELNSAGTVTARGKRISDNVVHQKLGHMSLRLKHERQRARDIISRALVENRPRPEIREDLEKQAPRLGPWTPQRLSDEIRQIRRGAPRTPPLPTMLPAQLEKDQVLEEIERGIAAGENWTTLATRLNDSALRPPRGRAFTPVQVRLLYLRSKGLTAFKLPSPRRASPGGR